MENKSIDSETWVKPDSFSSIKVFLKMIILFLLTFSLNQEVYNKREGSLTWGTCCWLKDSGFRVLRVSCLWLVLWITDKSEVSSCFLPNSHGRWIIGLCLCCLCCLIDICTRNRFHGNDAQWWNLPKRPGVKAEGLVDFFSQRGGMWHSISCLFVTELLRMPFSCYNYQLFAGDSFLL